MLSVSVKREGYKASGRWKLTQELKEVHAHWKSK